MATLVVLLFPQEIRFDLLCLPQHDIWPICPGNGIYDILRGSFAGNLHEVRYRLDEELHLPGLRACNPHRLAPTLWDVVAVFAIEGRHLGRSRFVAEVASDPEGTVWPTAATDTDTLAVTVQNLRLEAILDRPCL